MWQFEWIACDRAKRKALPPDPQFGAHLHSHHVPCVCFYGLQESMFRFTVSLHCDRLFMLPLCSGRIWKCQQQQRQQQQQPSVEHKRSRKNFLKTKGINKRKIPIESYGRNRSLSFDYFVPNWERSFPYRWSHVNFSCCMCWFMFRIFFSLPTEQSLHTVASSSNRQKVHNTSIGDDNKAKNSFEITVILVRGKSIDTMHQV